MEPLLRRHCPLFGLRQALRAAPAFMQPAVLAHQARQPPQSAKDAALRQRRLYPAHAVAVIVGTLIRYLLYLARKKFVSIRPAFALEIAVIAGFAAPSDLPTYAYARCRRMLECCSAFAAAASLSVCSTAHPAAPTLSSRRSRQKGAPLLP